MTPELTQQLEGLITQTWDTVHDPNLLVCRVPKTELLNGGSQRVLNLLDRVTTRPIQSLVLVTSDEILFGFSNRSSQTPPPDET